MSAFIAATLSEWAFSRCNSKKDKIIKTLGISGFEVFDIEGIADDLKPKKKITVTAISQNGSKKNFTVICRIDTPNEVDYYKHDGILQYVLRSLLEKEQPIVEQETKPTS